MGSFLCVISLSRCWNLQCSNCCSKIWNTFTRSNFYYVFRRLFLNNIWKISEKPHNVVFVHFWSQIQWIIIDHRKTHLSAVIFNRCTNTKLPQILIYPFGDHFCGLKIQTYSVKLVQKRLTWVWFPISVTTTIRMLIELKKK